MIDEEKLKQNGINDYVYDPRDCKDCKFYRECYYIEGGKLVNIHKPICLQQNKIAEFNHKGCFSFEYADIENTDEEKIDVSVALTLVSRQMKRINNNFDIIKAKYNIK